MRGKLLASLLFHVQTPEIFSYEPKKNLFINGLLDIFKSRSGRAENLVPTGMPSRIVQPVVSWY